MIYPKTPDTFWSFKYALKFISKKASLPPLGLMTVAALLPRHWQIKLVDENVEKLKDKDVLWADYVFVSAMIIQEQSARKIISRCKNLGRKVVAGGPLFTLEPEKFLDVDHLLVGEAEVIMPNFIEDVLTGSARHIYKKNGAWADLKNTIVPRFDLIKRNRRKYATMSLQFSRGCPFDCEFCNISALLGKVYRTKNSAQILLELDEIYASGWRGAVFFVDDNLIGNKSKLKREILPAIEKWMVKRNYPFTFITQASIDLAEDRELMRAMARAGFDAVFIGIETPIAESLVECNKKKNQQINLVEAVKLIQQNGIEVQAGFIVGFDNDPQDVFDRMIAFIQESGIVTAMVGMLNAPKGTKLYERLMKEKRIVADTTGDNTDLSTNIIPILGLEQLRTGYIKILKTIYSPEYLYDRLKIFLKNFNPHVVKSHDLRPTRILAGFRSTYWLGFFGRERMEYWRLFFWTLYRRPKLFAKAITLAIYGHHFGKTFRNHIRRLETE